MKFALKHLCLLSLLGLLGVSQASAEIVFRYSEGGPNRGTRAEAVQYFADEVERLSGGEMSVDIHWGGALLKWSGVLDGIAAGTADMGSVLSSYEPSKLTALGIGDIPLEYSDPWVGMRAMYDLMTEEPEMAEAMGELELVYLSNFSTSGVQFECTEGNEIKTVEDIQGKRMRATGTYSKVLDDLGANMVNLTFGKVYQALDSGLVDCLGSYFYTMRAYKTYEVVDTVTRVDWGQLLGFAIVMNQYSWLDLNEEQQAVLRQAGSRMIDHFAHLLIEDGDEVARMLDSGGFGKTVPVTQIAAAEREKILKATLKFRDSWIEEANQAGIPGEKLWSRYEELLEEYQQKLKGSDYPWVSK